MTSVTTALGGRYRVGKILGVGGMAEVRSADDERLGRSVAVKLLREDLAGVPEIRTRFEHEARAAAALSHPNIVAVFDVDIDPATNRPYLVMERLPGTTLADEIARGPLEPDRVIDMAMQVVDGLATAHAAGIVHRDVKPGNVLHAGDGTWKVADFGIAKSTESIDTLTTTGFVLCTPGYVAPERLAGDAATPASDLFSLGVVLYEALSGSRPFVADTAVGTAHRMRTEDAAPLVDHRPDVDPGLAAVVHTALERDPARRFGSADEMRAALIGLGGEPSVAPGVNPTVPVRRSTDSPTHTAPVAPRPVTRSVWAPTPGLMRAVAVGAGVAVVAALVALGAGEATPDSSVPPSTVPVTTPAPTPETPAVPSPLADALDRLDDAVQP